MFRVIGIYNFVWSLNIGYTKSGYLFFLKVTRFVGSYQMFWKAGMQTCQKGENSDFPDQKLSQFCGKNIEIKEQLLRLNFKICKNGPNFCHSCIFNQNFT